MSTMQADLNNFFGGTDVVNIAIIIGLFKIVVWALQLLGLIWQQFFRGCFKSKNHVYNTYASQNGDGTEKSWAVVTGGSDGIGLTMCKKLAREGFNICIVSRNESKINEKLDEIRSECRLEDNSFKTLCLVADLGKLRTIEEYKSFIGEKLQNIDVAVLVLNAGIAVAGPFLDISSEEVEMQQQVNGNHVIYLAKVMLAQLAGRMTSKGRKSAMVIISSTGSLVPFSGLTTYCATKAFASFMGQGLNYELKDKVDVMSFCPGGVKTKMLVKELRDCFMISTEKAVDACFRDLGHQQYTHGALRHYIMVFFWVRIPTQIMQAFFYPNSKKIYAREQQGKAAQNANQKVNN